jgi:hypothetical protein
MGGSMNNTVHTKRITLLAAAVAAAVAMSLGVGSAFAAPLKNAQRVCEKAGGSFTGSAARYDCSGNDSTRTFAFLKSAQGQCVHSFKGSFSVPTADSATGDWHYTCVLQF